MDASVCSVSLFMPTNRSMRQRNRLVLASRWADLSSGACFFVARGPRVTVATGLPCALSSGDEGRTDQNFGRIAPRDRALMTSSLFDRASRCARAVVTVS